MGNEIYLLIYNLECTEFIITVSDGTTSLSTIISFQIVFDKMTIKNQTIPIEYEKCGVLYTQDRWKYTENKFSYGFISLSETDDLLIREINYKPINIKVFNNLTNGDINEIILNEIEAEILDSAINWIQRLVMIRPNNKITGLVPNCIGSYNKDNNQILYVFFLLI